MNPTSWCDQWLIWRHSLYLSSWLLPFKHHYSTQAKKHRLTRRERNRLRQDTIMKNTQAQVVQRAARNTVRETHRDRHGKKLTMHLSWSAVKERDKWLVFNSFVFKMPSPLPDAMVKERNQEKTVVPHKRKEKVRTELAEDAHTEP